MSAFIGKGASKLKLLPETYMDKKAENPQETDAVCLLC